MTKTYRVAVKSRTELGAQLFCRLHDCTPAGPVTLGDRDLATLDVVARPVDIVTWYVQGQAPTDQPFPLGTLLFFNPSC